MKFAQYLLLLFCGAVLSSLSLAAQGGGESGRNAPDIPVVTRAIAIANARIVVRPGQVIEGGTVVMRDGLIEAVGNGVAPPYDARVIDGTGLTVYAGFIDGCSWGGTPKPEEQNGKVPLPGDPPPVRAGITPERDVRTLFNTRDSYLDSLRRAGFAAANIAPRGGMLPGTGALMLLGGRDTGRYVLRGNAFLAATFEGANDVYPATPMGIMAKLRNLFRQARQMLESGAAFTADPNGFPRPADDPVRTAFFGPVKGSVPVLFRVGDDLEVRRALLLSRELDFPLVLAGLRNGRDVADLIRTENVPLFLSLDFPDDVEKKGEKKNKGESEKKESDSTSSSAPDGVAEQGDSAFRPVSVEEIVRGRARDYNDLPGEYLRRRTVREESRRAALGTPAFFHRARTRFGFASAGTDGAALRENLIAAVKNGLPEDAALAALTTEASAMIGMERALGTVERGKIANLVVTAGPYFADTSRVRMTIVDGVLYDYATDGKEEKPEGEKKKGAGGTVADVPAPVNAAEQASPGRLVAMNRDRSGNILIRNATVLTVTKGTQENADVLVRNGKIAAVGKGLSAPSGTEVIDGTGKYVMPGIIDAHSHIAVSGPVNEWTNPVTAEVRIEDVIDPYDITIYRALAGGVTTSHVMHGSANPIGGQGETIKHRYGEVDPEKLKMENAPRTIKFALGENPTRVHGRGYGVPPFTRMGVEQSYREAFTEAQRYMIEQEAFEKGKKDGKRVAPPRHDERLEALADILRGKILIHCHSYRADEILMLMRVLKDFGINRIVFQHVNEGFKVAPELAEFGAMASVFSDWWAYKFEVYYSTAYNAAILTRNGVVTSINSDSPELNRHLYHEAAKSMRNGGLAEQECLAMITINPARQLGVEDRIGSIEVGKEGDLAIFDAHPLSIYARPVMTIVDGVIRFDAERDPDDMRLKVDPEERIDAVTVFHEHEDRCMEGTEGIMNAEL